MRVTYDYIDQGQRAETLVILLPGALQASEELVQAGFIDTVRTRELPVDLMLADLGLEHIGDTTNGTALQLIDEALVQPARLQGYASIWLAGISIGGFIALAYAAKYPGKVDGVSLLGPYPGSRILHQEIDAAGGLGSWSTACDSSATDEDMERMVWRWLQRRAVSRAALPVYLGYGIDDRFASGQRLMASALPRECVDTVKGAHDWLAWRQLWEKFLERVALEVTETSSS